MDGLAVPAAFFHCYVLCYVCSILKTLSEDTSCHSSNHLTRLRRGRKIFIFIIYLFKTIVFLFKTSQNNLLTRWWWTGCRVCGVLQKRKWAGPADRKKGFNSGTMASNSGTKERAAVSEPIRRRKRRRRKEVEEKVRCSRNFAMKWEEKKGWM